MSDHRIDRIERENAETLHFIMTPIRMLMNFIKLAFMVVVLVMLLLVNEAGWLVNLGSRSQRARNARQNRLEAQIDPSPGRHWSVFDVDFRIQPNPVANIGRENRFWDDDRPLYKAQMEEDENWDTKAFTTTWIRWGGNPGEGIPYCTMLMHSDRVADFYDATPGSWSTRSDDALDRKSARMQRDYEIAAMMMASLRSTLAQMKLHRPLSEVFDHHAYCDADAAIRSDPKDPRYGRKGLLAYVNVLLNIDLNHAPVVRFRYVGIDPDSADIDTAHSINLTEVWGMCLPDSCTGGLGRGTTYFDDIFADQAPLTDEQMQAETAIMAMTTKEFWEQARWKMEFPTRLRWMSPGRWRSGTNDELLNGKRVPHRPHLSGV